MDKMLNDLQGNLSKAMKGLNKALASLPDEAKAKMPNAMSDVNRIRTALKNSDMSVIEEISKRYANTNNE